MIEITEEPNEDRMSAEELATQQEDFARQLYAHAEGVETGYLDVVKIEKTSSRTQPTQWWIKVVERVTPRPTVDPEPAPVPPSGVARTWDVQRAAFQPTEPVISSREQASRDRMRIGSNSARQSVGEPGHCNRCAKFGHVKAHPNLGCGDVGCDVGH